MAKKRRPKKSRESSSTPKALTTEELESKAAEHLQAGRFRDAVADCKELVRRESTPERVERLAEAYAGRAEELLAKGMVQEAMMIWRNRHEICGVPLNDPQYFQLLVQSETPEKLKSWLAEQLPTLVETPKRLAEIRQICAAQILGGMPELLEPWPDDDPLRKDLPTAELALDAYSAGNDEALREALKGIPYRSPFRDLKMILSALPEIQQKPDAVKANLARIDDHSPFQPLVRAIRVGLEGQESDTPIPRPIQAFSDALSGRSGAVAKARADFEKFARANSVNDYSGLFKLIVRHRKALGDGYAIQACKHLVVTGSAENRNPRLLQQYDQALGVPDGFERYRLSALITEHSREERYDAVEIWEEALDHLARCKLYPAREHPLIKALIYRRIAMIIRQEDEINDEVDDEYLEYLEKAVEYDPEDREAVLQLIEGYRKFRNLKKARELAASAEARWPGDAGVLIQSVRNAIESKAFKKAARISRQVLELDPVNREVKGILLEAQLSHARKQIAGGKSHLAEKELDEAREWAMQEPEKGRIDLLAGMVAFALGQKGEAKSALASGCERLGPLAGRFVLTFEALGLDLDPKALMRAAGIRQKPDGVKAEDIMALVPILDAAYSDADKRRFHNEALEKLIPVLKGSSKLLTSEAHLVRLCEVWHRTFWTHKSLLGPYAKQGARLFPETLLFDFYLTISETEPGERLHWRQRDRLIKLLEVAQERGESKLASQITQRLMEDDRMVRMAGFPSMPGGGLWDDLEEDLDDEYDQLGLFDPFDDSPEGQGPEALFAALLGKGMPAEIEMILDQISHITGIDDRIELMRILIEKFEEGGDAPALDDLLPGANKKPKPRPKKSKRPKR